MDRLNTYTYNFINPFLLQKKSLISSSLLKNTFYFNKIRLNLSLNNLPSEEDMWGIGALSYLEMLTGQKAHFTKKKFAYVGSQKKFTASIKVTLRNKRMRAFLEYYYFIILPSFFRRYGMLPNSKSMENNCYSLSIDDLGILYDFRYSFLKNSKLKLSFFKNEKNGLNVPVVNYFTFFGLIKN